MLLTKEEYLIRQSCQKIFREKNPGHTRDDIVNEIHKNFEIFQSKYLLPLINHGHKYKYALMLNGELIDVFDSSLDATVRASESFPEKIFNIQFIDDEPVRI